MLGSKDIGTGNQTSVYGLIIRDYVAFMLTKSQFQAWNISSFGSMSPWTTSATPAEFSDTNHALSSFMSGASGTALACEENTFYAALAAPVQLKPKDLVGVF